MRVDDAVGAVAVHGWTGFLALILMGIFGGGFPTGYMGASVEVTLLGQLVGVATLMPLAFISGYVVAWLLKKGNLLRVPVEVEITGIDKAEFGMDFFPDHQQADETIVMADGTTTSAAPVLQMALNDVIRG